MPSVRIDNGCIWRGEQRVPLLMGEMHYWRTSPHRWREILRAMRRLGLEMVATYVPWQYHELRPGEFDFTGRTESQRDLVGFLDLLQDEGLACFIRPGPYIYSEWTNAGVPDRVVRLPRISEEYRKEAATWMRAAVGVLRPYFATATERFPDGGPIVLFQPDNEVDLFSHWFEGEVGLDGAGIDVSRCQVVKGAGSDPPAEPSSAPSTPRHLDTPTPFSSFLRAAYSSVDELNRAWGTRYAAFEAAQPAASVVDRYNEHAMARSRDYWRFQHWATAQIVEWHTQAYRDLGVDLPMIANYYPGGDVQNWRELAKTSVDMLGIDWYPRNEFVGPPPPPGAVGATGGGGIFGLPPRREHRVFLDSCRMQRSVSRVPFIAELECGVWHGYQDYTGSFSPNHYRLLTCSALLAGVKGFNWYMFVGRDNWYFTPINERGDLRPELAEVFLDLHRVYRQLDVPTLERLVETAAYFECEQIGTDDLLGTNAALQALYDAQIDHQIMDAEALDRTPPRLLFYAAADWLPREKQAALMRYVENGGTLAVFRAFPRADERFEPNNGIGIAMPDRVLSHLGKKVEVDLGNGATGIGEGGVWVWDELPAGAAPIWGTQIAGKQQAIENADVWMRNYIGKRWRVGYRQRRGRGELIVIGLPVSADLISAVHAATGTAVTARAEVEGVQAALFRRAAESGQERYLIAANLNQHAVQTRVAIHAAGTGSVEVTDLFSGQERTMAADNLIVSMPRASGGAWRLRPAHA